MPLLCTGDKLPDIPTVNCSDSIKTLDNCCQLVEIETEILLFEKLETAYYWVKLEADEIQLVVCNLEAYANQASSWKGRRCDYLVMGMNVEDGDCYLIIIELRHLIVKEDQAIDKLNQVEQTIQNIISILPQQISNSPFFEQACPQAQPYKIAGIIIAPAGIRGIARENRTRVINHEKYQAIITMMPPEQVRNCTITWRDLLQQFVPPSRRR
jgi:hypothetical protein